jgi:hypothetical protein
LVLARTNEENRTSLLAPVCGFFSLPWKCRTPYGK